MKWNSKFFSYAEMIESATATRYAIDNTPPPDVLAHLADTAERMDHVRAVLGNHPVRVTSGYRNPRVDRLVKGSGTGHHTQGYAVDFQVPGFGPPKAVALELSHSGIKFDQLIYEGAWVHISFAPTMRKQLLTAVFSPGKKTTYLPGIVDP